MARDGRHEEYGRVLSTGERREGTTAEERQLQPAVFLWLVFQLSRLSRKVIVVTRCKDYSHQAPKISSRYVVRSYLYNSILTKEHVTYVCNHEARYSGLRVLYQYLLKRLSPSQKHDNMTLV